jgi:Luciferase
MVRGSGMQMVGWGPATGACSSARPCPWTDPGTYRSPARRPFAGAGPTVTTGRKYPAPLGPSVSVRQRLELELARAPGLELKLSRFGHGPSYFVGSREIAPLHGDGRLDVRLTRQRIRELKAGGGLDPRVPPRGPSADWVSVPLDDPRAIAVAADLVDEAIRANA